MLPLFAPLVFEGYFKGETFENWLEKQLFPKLKKGDVLVLDNASFHKGEKIQQMVSAAGCYLYYLPPYSPDFIKIEHW